MARKSSLESKVKWALVPMECSTVRRLRHRSGEVVNLTNKEAQQRSLAALLAKKGWAEKTRLGQLYSLSKTRVLTMNECSEIFRICSWKHGLDE